MKESEAQLRQLNEKHDNSNDRISPENQIEQLQDFFSPLQVLVEENNDETVGSKRKMSLVISVDDKNIEVIEKLTSTPTYGCTMLFNHPSIEKKGRNIIGAIFEDESEEEEQAQESNYRTAPSSPNISLDLDKEIRKDEEVMDVSNDLINESNKSWGSLLGEIEDIR